MYLSELQSCLDICLGVRLLGHMETQFLVFSRKLGVLYFKQVYCSLVNITHHHK